MLKPLRTCLLALSGVTIGLSPGLASATTVPVDRVATVVGNQVITQREWEQRVLQVRQQNEGRTLPNDLAEQVLEALVVERSQVQAALDMGVRVSEADVDQAEQRVAAQNRLALPVFLERMRQQGISQASFRNTLRDQLLIERAKERVTNERVKISPGEVQSFIQRKATRFPAMVNLAQILVPVPERASEAQRNAAKALAQSLSERAKAGAAFAALAQSAQGVSPAQSAEAMGLKPESDYPALFVKATAGQPVGFVSEPTLSGAGYHVLKVVERESARLTVAEPQVHVRHILLRPQNLAAREAAIAQLGAWRADILAGRAEFATLARQHSQDGSAAIGGDLGWASAGYFVPEFEAAVDALANGAIGEPLVTRFGVHLVQVLERRQKLMDDVALQEWARRELRVEQGAEVVAAWVREVRAAAYVRRMDIQ